MNTNGNGHAVIPERLLPQKHSQLSAAQRSKLTDDMVAAIQEQRKELNAHTAAIRKRTSVDEVHQEILREHRAMLDAHAGVVCRQTFWGRCRWLFFGR